MQLTPENPPSDLFFIWRKSVNICPPLIISHASDLNLVKLHQMSYHNEIKKSNINRLLTPGNWNVNDGNFSWPIFDILGIGQTDWGQIVVIISSLLTPPPDIVCRVNLLTFMGRGINKNDPFYYQTNPDPPLITTPYRVLPIHLKTDPFPRFDAQACYAHATLWRPGHFFNEASRGGSTPYYCKPLSMRRGRLLWLLNTLNITMYRLSPKTKHKYSPNIPIL